MTRTGHFGAGCGAVTVDAVAPRRTRVAVALGGGGARGYAHIGILGVLEDRGYDVVSVAGSSMGALVGGLYAARGLDAFAGWVRSLTHRDVLRLYDLSPRAPGAIRAEKIFARVSDILGDVRIEDLALPFTAVATDLMTGEEKWFREGPVRAAVRASVALPGFMTPVVIDGRLLADGGLVNPLPIAPTRAARADVTVAVAVAGPPRTPAFDPAAGPEARNGERGEVRRRIAGHVLDSELLRGLATRLTAVRSGLGGSADDEPADDVPETVFDALPSGLRLVDVMGLSMEAVRSAAIRHTLADHAPDVLVTIPRSCCRTLDFHRAEEMIELGRRLAADALDRAGHVSPAGAVGGRSSAARTAR
jgi:NTE family protein